METECQGQSNSFNIYRWSAWFTLLQIFFVVVFVTLMEKENTGKESFWQLAVGEEAVSISLN